MYIYYILYDHLKGKCVALTVMQKYKAARGLRRATD